MGQTQEESAIRLVEENEVTVVVASACVHLSFLRQRDNYNLISCSGVVNTAMQLFCIIVTNINGERRIIFFVSRKIATHVVAKRLAYGLILSYQQSLERAVIFNTYLNADVVVMRHVPHCGRVVLARQAC